MASFRQALNHFRRSGDAWTGRSVVGTAKCLAVVQPSVAEAWASASSIAVAHASEETTLFEDHTLTPPREMVSNPKVLDEQAPAWYASLVFTAFLISGWSGASAIASSNNRRSIPHLSDQPCTRARPYNASPSLGSSARTAPCARKASSNLPSRSAHAATARNKVLETLSPFSKRHLEQSHSRPFILSHSKRSSRSRTVSTLDKVAGPGATRFSSNVRGADFELALNV
mmetsp:Transcript_11203/g.34581  ORF Transcript_11203/g.34581 Transcript_11203/m.34581 type:complete len:228 (+) Transcript_11203:436-1119(+)